MADNGASTLTPKESSKRKENTEENPRTDAASADQQQPKIDALNVIVDAKPVSWKHPVDSGVNSIYRDAHWWHGLPPGWVMEERPRTVEKYIEKTDQYFYEPGTERQFRSFKAVQRHLQVTGQQQNGLENDEKLPLPPAGKENGEHPAGQNDEHKAMANGDQPESSGSHSKKKVRRKRKASIINFNFPNPPQK